MENRYSKTQAPQKNPKVDINNNLQIGTLAKLFRCEYEDVLTAVEKSNGTFVSVYEVITSKSCC